MREAEEEACGANVELNKAEELVLEDTERAIVEPVPVLDNEGLLDTTGGGDEDCEKNVEERCELNIELNMVDELEPEGIGRAMLELAPALDDIERLLDTTINDEDEDISGVPSTQYLFNISIDFIS
jgi:hypothetical protein